MTAAVVLLSIVITGAPASKTNLLIQAEAAFREGVHVRRDPASARRWFREATRHYEALRQRGIHNADLERNLGNAYLLAGDLPRAILAYRRGLALNPADDLLWANLAYARGQVVYSQAGNPSSPAADPWLLRLTHRATRLQFFAALALYALGWLGTTRWWMVRRASLLGVGLSAFALAGLVTAGLAIREWDQRRDLLHPVIVIAEDGVFARRGNGYTYPRRFDAPLNRGTEARLIFRRGDWLQVELSGGELGWLPSAKVLSATY